jgi:hypothetical protein
MLSDEIKEIKEIKKKAGKSIMKGIINEVLVSVSEVHIQPLKKDTSVSMRIM